MICRTPARCRSGTWSLRPLESSRLPLMPIGCIRPLPAGTVKEKCALCAAPPTTHTLATAGLPAPESTAFIGDLPVGGSARSESCAECVANRAAGREWRRPVRRCHGPGAMPLHAAGTQAASRSFCIQYSGLCTAERCNSRGICLRSRRRGDTETERNASLRNRSFLFSVSLRLREKSTSASLNFD
jgi:hypothetical protein